MRVGMRVGPVYASTRINGKKEAEHWKGFIGGYVLFIAIMAAGWAPWHYLHWWSLAVYIPVGLPVLAVAVLWIIAGSVARKNRKRAEASRFRRDLEQYMSEKEKDE